MIKVAKHIINWFRLKRYRKENTFIKFQPKFLHKHQSLFKLFSLFGKVAFFYLEKKYNLKVRISINNIYWAVGHVYPEYDWLCRLNNYNMKNGYALMYIYAYPSCSLTRFFKENFKHPRVKVLTSNFLYICLYSYAIRNPNKVVDVSTSSLCSQSREGVISHRNVFRYKQFEYASILRAQEKEKYPLLENYFGSHDLPSFIKNKEKFALIQIKTQIVNATLQITSPNTYLKTINFLRNQGYQVIFVGREKMPKIFEDYGVYNYAESNFANAENDYLLNRYSKFTLSSASGFSYMADTMGTPLLSINSWYIIGYPGRKTTNIPSRIKYRGELLGPIAQVELFYKIGQVLPWREKELLKNITPINVDDDEIFAVTKLIITNKNYFLENMSEYEIRFQQLFPNDIPSIELSRYSYTYLNEVAKLFPEDFDKKYLK